MPTYATVVGRLGQDPKTRTVGDGSVTELSVASDHGFGDRKSTTWIRASIWGKSGQAAAQHLSKGDGVICTGQLYVREYDRNDGGKGYSVELDRADWTFAPGAKPAEGQQRSEPRKRTQPARKPAGGGYGGQSGGGYGGQSSSNTGRRDVADAHLDDDIPF